MDTLIGFLIIDLGVAAIGLPLLTSMPAGGVIAWTLLVGGCAGLAVAVRANGLHDIVTRVVVGTVYLAIAVAIASP